MRNLKTAALFFIVLAGGFLGGVLAGMLIPARNSPKEILDEINAKRITIIEDNGSSRILAPVRASGL